MGNLCTADMACILTQGPKRAKLVVRHTKQIVLLKEPCSPNLGKYIHMLLLPTFPIPQLWNPDVLLSFNRY